MRQCLDSSRESSLVSISVWFGIMYILLMFACHSSFAVGKYSNKENELN
jgi:hypothetical protein